MDIDERLQLLLSDCLWTREQSAAVRWLPGLAAQAPAFIALPTASGEATAVIPMSFLGALSGPVVRVMSEALAAHAAGRPLAGAEGLDAGSAQADPLIGVLAGFFAQVARSGLRAHSVPALGLAAVAQRAAGGTTLPGLPDAQEAEAGALAQRIAALEPAARGEALRAIAWALSSRVSAAIGLAAAAGAPLDLSGLLRATLPNPLVLCCERSQLSGADGLALAVAALGVKLPPVVLTELAGAASAALTAARAAAAKGEGSGPEQAIVAIFGESEDIAQPLLHPDGGPALVVLLADALGERGLKAAGCSKATIKALTDPRGRAALAAGWRQLGRGLGEWDVLSALVRRVLPIDIDNGRVSSTMGGLPADARWSLLVPRPDAYSAVGAVLALRVSELRAAMAGSLAGRPWAGWAVERAVEAVCKKAGATVREWRGDHLICAWPTPELALRQAQLLREALRPGATLLVGPEESAQRIPEAGSIGIGLAVGVIDGGTDGEQSALGGEAVATALCLAGSGRVGRLVADPLGDRRSGLGQTGLESEGVVCSGAFVRLLVERAKKRGEPVHLRGEGGAVAGVEADFDALPVLAYWQPSKTQALVAVHVLDGPVSRFAAAELRWLSPGELAALRQSDVKAAKVAASRAALPAGPTGGDLFSDPPPAARPSPAPAPASPWAEELPSGSLSAAPAGPAAVPRPAAPSFPDAPSFPGDSSFPGAPSLTGSPSFSDPPSFPGAPSFPGGSSFPGAPPPAVPPEPRGGPPPAAAPAPAPAARASAPMVLDPFGEPDALDAPLDGALGGGPSGFGFGPAPSKAPAAAAPRPSAPVSKAPEPFADDPFADEAEEAGPALHDFAGGAAKAPKVAPSAPMILDEDLGSLDDLDKGPPVLPRAPAAPAPTASSSASSSASSTRSSTAARGPAAPMLPDDDDPFAAFDFGGDSAGGENGGGGDPFGGDHGVSAPGLSPPAAPPMMLDEGDPFAAPAARGPSAGGPVPAAGATAARAKRSMAPLLARQFKDYVYVINASGVAFGLRDGARLRDAIQSAARDVEAATMEFLLKKVEERLATEADRVIALRPGDEPKPLSAELVLSAAARCGL